ncbi:hypothetical protein FS749_005216 [Ceratobasidium sp. UAMH 11750]|nr:hypothetical protein FS749_005216 [Ceratobasidium sp. UAMH 11750]
MLGIVFSLLHSPHHLINPPATRQRPSALPTRPAPVSAKSATSIRAQLSSSLSAALLNPSSATYRTPYVVRLDLPDRSLSPAPAPPEQQRPRPPLILCCPPRRQYTHPFMHRSRSSPTLVACAEWGLSNVSHVVNHVDLAAYLLSRSLPLTVLVLHPPRHLSGPLAVSRPLSLLTRAPRFGLHALGRSLRPRHNSTTAIRVVELKWPAPCGARDASVLVMQARCLACRLVGLPALAWGTHIPFLALVLTLARGVRAPASTSCWLAPVPTGRSRNAALS